MHHKSRPRAINLNFVPTPRHVCLQLSKQRSNFRKNDFLLWYHDSFFFQVNSWDVWLTLIHNPWLQMINSEETQMLRKPLQLPWWENPFSNPIPFRAVLTSGSGNSWNSLSYLFYFLFAAHIRRLQRNVTHAHTVFNKICHSVDMHYPYKELLLYLICFLQFLSLQLTSLFVKTCH